MQVQDIMTSNPTCCDPNTSIQEAAALMAEKSVGSIPVLNDAGEPVGIVTDRDICCGAVAQRKTVETPVSEVMSNDLLTVSADDDVESCCNKMEEKQVLRSVVTDESGKCCGVVAQADVAREAGEAETAELVEEVSQPKKKSGCC
tara:strand:- start:124 stop:558 length:435 start_codon:yes stop_codon:yes gene_type:complete